jgi:hypothetical protein
MSDNTDPIPTPDPTPDPTPEPPKPPSELDALRQEIETLKAKTAAAEAVAEEARRAKLSDAERYAEDRRKLDEERAALTESKRQAALDRLGVLPKVRQLAPAGDPSDPHAMAAIERWARENPEFVRRVETPQHVPVPEQSNLAKVLSGKINNRFAKLAFDKLTGEG